MSNEIDTSKHPDDLHAKLFPMITPDLAGDYIALGRAHNNSVSEQIAKIVLSAGASVWYVAANDSQRLQAVSIAANVLDTEMSKAAPTWASLSPQTKHVVIDLIEKEPPDAPAPAQA